MGQTTLTHPGLWRIRLILNYLKQDLRELDRYYIAKIGYFSFEREILDDLNKRGLIEQDYLDQRYKFHDRLFPFMDEKYLVEKNKIKDDIYFYKQLMKEQIQWVRCKTL